MDMSGDSYGVDLHFLAIRVVAVVVLLAGAWVHGSKDLGQPPTFADLAQFGGCPQI